MRNLIDFCKTLDPVSLFIGSLIGIIISLIGLIDSKDATSDAYFYYREKYENCIKTK